MLERKLYKCLSLLVVFVSVSMPGFSQRYISEVDKTPFADRVYFGGNFSASFGEVKHVDLSPLAGYMINKKLSSGIGLTYLYESATFNFGGGTSSQIKARSYGSRLFVRYNLSELLFSYAEYERINIPQFDFYYNERGRLWVPSLYLGGGFMKFFKEKRGFGITLLYDLFKNNKAFNSSGITTRLSFVF